MEESRKTIQRENYVPAWGPERFIVPLLEKRIRELFAQFAGKSSAEIRVLDVGCGAQPFRAMVEDAGYRYFSIDVVQNVRGTVDFIGAIDSELPTTIASEIPYDFLLCTEVLEHVADWQVAFDNLARLLAPGGRLLITCPHFYPLHEVPYDFWRPTPYAIRHYAAGVGLEVEFFEQAGGPWEVLGTLLGEAHAYPRTGRLADRVMAWVGRKLRAWVLAGLQSDWLSQRVELRGPYYLSNIAILTRPNRLEARQR